MKTFFLIISTFILAFQTSDLEKIRNQYPAANLSSANAEKFKTLVAKTPSSDAVFKGYKAAAQIISAKFMKGNERKTALTSGIKSLENTVSANPNMAELRLLRLSIQENLPKIVKYSSKIEEDKNFLLKNYSKQNAALKNFIRAYFSTSKVMTPAEKSSLK